MEESVINSIEKLNPKLIRFDRNLAKNGISFAQFGDDGDLIFDLVVYFANTYQNNFFGFGKLDVDDFCKTMNYKKSNLFKSHPNPLQFEDKAIKKKFDKIIKDGDNSFINNGKSSINKNDFFYTVLDNALYKLQLQGVPFRFLYKTDLENGTSVTSLKLLNAVIKKYKIAGANNPNLTKVVYEYSLSDDYTKNLSKFFLNIDLNSIVSLRKLDAVYLYSYLKNLEVALSKDNKKVTDSMNFDLLVELAQINVPSPRKAKLALNKKLKYVFSKTDLKGKVEWKKRVVGGKEVGYAFQPVITFEPNIKKLHSKEYILEVLDTVTNSFLHEVLSYYRSSSLNPSLSFSEWFLLNVNNEASQDYKVIKKIAKEKYEEITNEVFSYSDHRITRLLKSSVDAVIAKKQALLNK